MKGGARRHMSPYDDTDDDIDEILSRSFERDTGSVPFGSRACEACNAAGERAEVMASALASASMEAAPTLADIGKDALFTTERAGIVASETIALAIVSSLDESLRHVICEETDKSIDLLCTAAVPTIDKVERALNPYVGHIGKLLIQVDDDMHRDGSVAKAALQLEHFCCVLVKASRNVEDRMLHVSASLGKHLTKLAEWGVRQMGVGRKVRPRGAH